MNILIIRVSAIGDVIHTLPSIFLIKESLPTAQISWVVQKKAAALIESQPFLNNVWVLPDHYLAPRNWISTWRLLKKIRSMRWDIILDFQGLLKTSALIIGLSGKKYGFDRVNARCRYSTWFTNRHIKPTYNNIIQKNLSLVSQALTDYGHTTSCPTIDALKKRFYLHVPITLQQKVQTWFDKHNIKHFIALCPNTTWESKHWPLEQWQDLITLLSNDYKNQKTPYVPLLIGKDFGSMASQLAHYAQRENIELAVLPAWDLSTTAFVVSQADLVIGPDTGLLHLADFFGIPMLGIFGPTSKIKHGPFLHLPNINNTIQVDCPHHYQKRHSDKDTPKQQQNCMSQLKADMVFTSIRNILGI